MKDNRMKVGFDGYAESVHNQQAKEKMAVLNEAVKLASKFCEVDRKEFIKSFHAYVFNQSIKSEPEEKRGRINANEWCSLYGIPYSELSSLFVKFNAIKGEFILSECGTFYLKPDFTIYLNTDEQIRAHEEINKLCKLLNSGCKRFVQRSVIELGLNGYIKHDSSSVLVPNINRIKLIK